MWGQAVLAVSKVLNLKANHNRWRNLTTLGSVSKVLNLKANHNHVFVVFGDSLAVLAVSKVLNLKANHNLAYPWHNGD